MSSTDDDKSRAVLLIELAQELCDVHLDQHGTPFAWIKNPGRVLMLRGREFHSYLLNHFYTKYGEACGSEALGAALGVLGARAYERPRVELSVRAKSDDSSILIDTADDTERAIQITPGGWAVVPLDRPIFRRFSHMLPFVPPAEARRRPDEKSVSKLISMFKLKDPADEILLAAALGTAFISHIPRPIVILHGRQGGTKTSLAAAVRGVIDPSSLPTLSLPWRTDEVVQALAHHYLAPFDNVQKLGAAVLDTLCRACTGDGVTKRALYTDEDDVIHAYRRSMWLTAVNLPGARPDFVDRTLPIEMTRVALTDRKEEAEVQREVRRLLPGVIREVLDALSVTLRTVQGVRLELKELPRMADFAVWGEAFARALGYEPNVFMKRYLANIKDASTAALESDVVGDLVMRLLTGSGSLDGVGRFEGTADDLLRAIREINDTLKLVKPEELPGRARELSAALKVLEVSLEDEGWRVTRSREPHTGKRLITIEQDPVVRAESGGAPQTPSPSSPASPEPHETGEPTGDADDDAPSTIVTPSSPDSKDHETDGRVTGDDGDAECATSPMPYHCPEHGLATDSPAVLSAHLDRFHRTLPEGAHP